MDRRPAPVHPGGEFRDASRLAGCEGVADHVSDVVGDEIDLVDLERVEYGGDVARLGLLVVATGGVEDRPMPRRSGTMTVAARQPGGERRPYVARLSVAVEQHDRRPLPADAHEDLCTAGRDHSGLELAGNEGPGLGRRRQEHGAQGNQGECSHF